jgi:TetR/AcrR family transcriptional regulator, transcriptional repressor for nem operon
MNTTIASTTDHDSHPGPGRPRGFDMDTAVDAGVAILLRNGFEATSLDALTRAMGISRSSFYAAFGSKHGVLVRALERYSRTRLRVLEELATGPGALREVLRALAGLQEDVHGCLLVNCVTELAPRDAEVGTFGAAHLRQVEAIVGRCLPRPDAAAAAALVAVTLGAQTLRKSGEPPERLARIIDLAIDRIVG